MTARVTPYLSFAGTAREAMEFYKSVFGGTLEIRTFADMHRAADSGQADLVGHSMLKGATGVMLMASDSAAVEPEPAGSVSIALGGDETELTGYWNALCEGGTVVVPFATSSWGALYGHCVDKFGTAWLINVTS